jgi:DNA-binding NarL/FixJ family response regulator
MEKIRVVIADDQSLITQSFKVLLETAAKDITVVGTARDGAEAAAVVEREKPDVVLMDVRMPVMDGVQATRLIHERQPAVRIIVLTTFDDDAYVHEAIRGGAVGYLLKDISTEELLNSIRAARHGTIMVSSTVAQKLVQGDGPNPPPTVETPAGSARELLNALSRREIDILRLLVQGCENKEIGERLHSAEQTIKNAVSVIYQKLGVESRKEARRLALKSGLVKPEDILGA